MLHNRPPLFVIAEFEEDSDLQQIINGCEQGAIMLNEKKFEDMEPVELVFGGMTFVLSLHSADELQTDYNILKLPRIFCDTFSKTASAIGISLGSNNADGKHSTTVNRSLLQLSGIIGRSVDAEAIAWLPAGHVVGFQEFAETADKYAAGGPFPALIQIGFIEDANGDYHSRGLEYFAEQEVHLTAPDDYSANAVLRRLVRIFHDMATNGKIDTAISTEGMEAGERIDFRPRDDLKTVDIDITRNESVSVH